MPAPATPCMQPLDEAGLAAELAGLGVPLISIASAAEDRQTYLMRPDLGRRLAAGADVALAAHRGDYDAVFVIADGLSARAVQLHAAAGPLPNVAGAPGGRLDDRSARHRPSRPGRRRRRRCRRALSQVRRRADRRTPGPVGARQHGRLSDLATACGHQRRRAQLHFQHSPRRHRLRCRRFQARRIFSAPCGREACRAWRSRTMDLSRSATNRKSSLSSQSEG